MIHRFYLDTGNLDRHDLMAYNETLDLANQHVVEYGPFMRYMATESWRDPDTGLLMKGPCLIYEIDSDYHDLSKLANTLKDLFNLESVIWAIVPIEFKL